MAPPVALPPLPASLPFPPPVGLVPLTPLALVAALPAMMELLIISVPSLKIAPPLELMPFNNCRLLRINWHLGWTWNSRVKLLPSITMLFVVPSMRTSVVISNVGPTVDRVMTEFVTKSVTTEELSRA